MRVIIGHGERTSGYVTLGPYGKSLRIQAFASALQPEFDRFVRTLYVRYQVEPMRRKLTPREFLALLPLRLRGINWAVVDNAPARRRRPAMLPALHPASA